MRPAGEESAREHGWWAHGSGDEFDQLPLDVVVRAFGVDYGHVCPPEGGDLFVTRFGWPVLKQLLPNNWYTDQWYAKEGEKLRGSTGHVYHVPTRPVAGKSLELVVKFSRVAQDVPLVVETTFPEDVRPEVIAGARFNSPMEEFGLVMELRTGAFGPRQPRILTQRPLAIYAPPEEFELWQLGRSKSSFRTHTRLLEEDQEDAVKAIELDIKRMYVLVYGWIKGKDAEECFDAGEIEEDEFLGLSPRVVGDLEARGFRVLDNKPKHYILRNRRTDGRVLRNRDGSPAYGLVDFELLQRTKEHQRQYKERQREKYWRLQSIGASSGTSAAPSHLKHVTIFGIDYLYGQAPDGGRLWVVGKDPGLFDFFVPERWRRTGRIKLSPVSDVYQTCTRDGIHVVYRRSRVGVRPRVDPLADKGDEIRSHGYNSPFEEVAIARRLRQMGIPTTYARAIFRTGHHAMKATHLRDGRRFLDHAELVTPEQPPEAVLAQDYDYYTIWDYFRGVDLAAGESGEPAGAVELDRAVIGGFVTQSEHDRIVERTLKRLQAVGLAGEELDTREFVIVLGEGGDVSLTADGEFAVLTAVDALTAFEHGLLSDDGYREVVEQTVNRLRAVDCELIEASGKHMLLAMDPDGKFTKDNSGRIVVTLCNFELVRGLYRPFR
jgi:hypothetical protein